MIFRLTSKKPILLVGSGVRLSGAAELLHELIKNTDIPVLTTMNAVDLIQDDMKLGFIGVYGNRVANIILSECDLVISIGARLGLRQVGHITERFAPKAGLIRADIDQYELSRHIKSGEEKYLIDAKEFLVRLLEESIPKYTEWKNKCFEVKELLKEFDRETGNMVMEKISSVLPENPVIAIDVGQNECWAAQSLILKGNKGRMLISGGYGSMGCALPFAIGASIAIGKDKVFCITGDGGLQMNIQELETVAREKLPVKIMVVNNYALGKISEVQVVSYGSRYAQTTRESGYSVPDFEKISKAYGIRGATLDSYEVLDDYKDWLVDRDPCLLNINIPCDSRLIPKISWKTGEIKPEIAHDVMMKVEEIFR